MRTLTITINNSVIFNEVSKLASYIGSKNLDENKGPIYDSFKPNKSDAPLIDTYIKEATNKIITACAEYISNSNDNEITLRIPETFPVALEKETQETANNFVINYTFASWCSYNAVENGKEYSELSGVALDEFLKRIYTRNKPSIPLTHAT